MESRRNKKRKPESFPLYRQLIKVLELENIGYWTKTQGSDIMHFSELAAEIIGIKTNDLTLPVEDFLNNICSEDRQNLEQYLNKGTADQDSAECSFKMTRFNSEAKEAIYVSMRITNLNGIKNRNLLTIGTLCDITKQEKFRREALRIKEKAEEINMQKNIFLANISHEIRTPMNSIIGFAELLNIGNLDARTRNEYFKIIKHQGQQLQKLVDDISELAKYETGDLKINKSPCNFNLLLNELLVSFNRQKSKLNKDNVSIKISLPPNEEIIGYTDSGRITQILSDVLNTSLYFTDRGTIEIGYYKADDTKLEFYVKDSGTGFTADEQKYIFDRLSQVQETIVKKFEGLGLSLTISKGLVKLMGGKIWLESEPGAGATYYFQIPYEELPHHDIIEEADEAPALSQFSWKDRIILVVEDDEVNYKFLEALLHNTDAQIIHADNGYQAIDLCKSINKIDLILMDLKLPDISGFEATLRIRKLNKDIPVIAQTALVLKDEKEKCLKAGCNDIITKPIEIEKLLSLINKYLNE
jgi:signal transduction histidine kinase/CheY-like chemotaxis protein